MYLEKKPNAFPCTILKSSISERELRVICMFYNVVIKFKIMKQNRG